MKAVITGGAGFIGSNVVDLLIEKGYEVDVVDDLSTGKKENVNPKANLILSNIAAPMTEAVIDELTSYFTGADVVFHLAALPRVEPSIVNPTKSHIINTDGTYNVFWAAKQAGVKNIIYSSSSSVYGDAKNVPTDENEPTSCMSPYALQKLIGDQYAELFCKLYDINITSLRYFNVYGNREPTEGAYVPVIGIWLRQLTEGKALTITGDGKQSRDFVNVADVARANVLAAEANLKGYNVFNIGSGKTYELNYLASLISENTTYIEPRIEPKHTCANINSITNAIGWKPTISIEDYLKDKINDIEFNDWISESKYKNIDFFAKKPVALDSPDHICPVGAKNDNSTNLNYIIEVESWLKNNLKKQEGILMDVGCAGGQLAVDFSNRGHFSIGIEGSSYPLENNRDNWKNYYGSVLHTCDATKPFHLKKNGKKVLFDLISAWEVVEHIHPDNLDSFFDNILSNLSPDGIFVVSINTSKDERILESGEVIKLHQSVFAKNEWFNKILKNRNVLEYPFKHKVRGGHPSEKSFHIALKRKND